MKDETRFKDLKWCERTYYYFIRLIDLFLKLLKKLPSYRNSDKNDEKSITIIIDELSKENVELTVKTDI